MKNNLNDVMDIQEDETAHLEVVVRCQNCKHIYNLAEIRRLAHISDALIRSPRGIVTSNKCMNCGRLVSSRLKKDNYVCIECRNELDKFDKSEREEKKAKRNERDIVIKNVSKKEIEVIKKKILPKNISSKYKINPLANKNQINEFNNKEVRRD